MVAARTLAPERRRATRDVPCYARSPAPATMEPRRKAQWQIHTCVVLWGFTAILGKLITLSALALVWWRMVIVVAVLLMVPSVRRGLRGISRRLALGYAGAGFLVALHWVTFY